MARKNKDFTNVFDSLNVEHTDENKESEEKEKVGKAASNEESSLQQKDITQEDPDIDTESNNFNDFKSSILSKYEEKRKKKTVEETHIRTTFLLHKDLAKRLNRITKNKHGLKTILLNDAVEAIVKSMEDNK